jgi:uncharacterized membrane protein
MEVFTRLIHALTVLHPLHPMLVHFPIALTGAGALFIFLAVWKKSAALEQAAFANITLAFVGSIAAAVTGIFDNNQNYDGTAPNAMWKITLALILLIVTGYTAYARWKNPGLFESKSRVIYVLSYLVSFGLALILAFLGGVILYGF